MSRTLCATLLLLAMTTSAAAHKASDAFLNLTVTSATIEGRVDIALRDLEQAVGLDADGNRAITWSELAAQRSALDSYVTSRLDLAADGTPCPIQPGALLVDRHSDGAYAVLRIVAACAAPPTRLSIDYRFLFDLDPLHRGLVQIADDGATVHTGVLSPEAPRLLVDVHASPDLLGQLVSFGWQGAWHIWLGFDHLLFLFSLLLPAVLHRENGRWYPVGTLREAAGEVVRVVSAFTLAHSITLCLATLGLVSLPSRLVEVGDRRLGRSGSVEQCLAGRAPTPVAPGLRLRPCPRSRLRQRAARPRPSRPRPGGAAARVQSRCRVRTTCASGPDPADRLPAARNGALSPADAASVLQCDRRGRRCLAARAPV